MIIEEEGDVCRSSDSDPPTHKVLLMVDDDLMAIRMLSRMLKKHYDEVYTATNPEEAEAILKNNSVSSLICDYNLGKDVPRGTDLITRWHGQYSSIKRFLLLTGEKPNTIELPPEVDSALYKPCSVDDVLEALGVVTE